MSGQLSTLSMKPPTQRDQLPAASVDPWREATESQRTVALKRERFLQPILKMIGTQVTTSVAVRNVLTHIECEHYPPGYLDLAKELARGKKVLPSRATVFNWLKGYSENGREGLLPSYTGRVRKEYGWEAQAIRLYNIPSKPAYADVAKVLREQYGEETATDSRVTRYLKNLPATLNSNSPHRLGRHHFDQNRRSFKSRDRESLLVGEMYEGDGHTVDAYIAHPNTGLPFRPELTAWMDIRSRYIVGWFFPTQKALLAHCMRCLMH